MNYGFKVFTDDFCKTAASECLKLIQSAVSFNLVAMPGADITYFAHYLETVSKDEFVFINTYEMPEFTKEIFYKQLLIKLGGNVQHLKDPSLDDIKELLVTKTRESDRKLVIVINRLDRLEKILDQNFFDILRFFKDVDRSKIVMIFISSQLVINQYSPKIKDLFNLISKTVYFKPYLEADLRQVLAVDGSLAVMEPAVTLCGGHHNLYNVLSRCQSLDNPLSDSMVELLVKDLLMSLPRKSQEELVRVAKKGLKPRDEFLLGLGYVQLEKGRYRLFSSLMTEYIIQKSKTMLPQKEKQLFDLLKAQVGRPVTKTQIFDAIWQQQDGIASDWALNSLVYRLRNHPAFDTKRYVIKSYKKLGYALHDEY